MPSIKNKKEIKLILGSASPFRKKLLEEAGFVFDVKTADIDEKAIRNKDFKKLVLRLALAKKDAILSKYKLNPNSILVTLDVVGVHNGELREKPISKKEVISWHKNYHKGKTLVHCAIVAHHVGSNKTLSFVDTSSIKWRQIPNRTISQIVNDPLTYKAAAFSDRSFLHYVEKLNGSIDTVIGVPVRILEEFLEELGYFK